MIVLFLTDVQMKRIYSANSEAVDGGLWTKKAPFNILKFFYLWISVYPNYFPHFQLENSRSRPQESDMILSCRKK
jgi:hypothetical protein